MSRLYDVRFAILHQRAVVHGVSPWLLPKVRCSRHGVTGAIASCPSETMEGIEDEARYRTSWPDRVTPATVDAREFDAIAAQLKRRISPECVQPAADIGPLVGSVKGPTTDVLWHSLGRLLFREEAVERLKPFALRGLRFVPCSLTGTRERFLELDPVETPALVRAARHAATPCAECGLFFYRVEPDKRLEWLQLAAIPDVDVMRPAGSRNFIVTQRFVDAAEELWLTNWAVDEITVITE